MLIVRERKKTNKMSLSITKLGMLHNLSIHFLQVNVMYFKKQTWVRDSNMGLLFSQSKSAGLPYIANVTFPTERELDGLLNN